MDGQRFDRLARAVASGASRRLVLKGIAAGVAGSLLGVRGLRPARSQVIVALGGSCSAFGANAECSQAGTPPGGVPVICSANSSGTDGQYNCCRNSGGVCSSDLHCCGTAPCVGGICGGTSTVGTSPLGALCTSTSQCSQAGGSVVCSDNGVSTDGPLNCCRNQGGSCIAGSNCCSGMACINGICGGSGGSSNLAPGSACNSTTECSQSGGSTVCADNGVTTDGARNCCRAAGGACSNSAGCCAGLTCSGGFCTQGGTTPTSGNLRLSAACTSVSQCSQTGGTVLCADNGYVDDGPLNCCRDRGGACFDTVRSADCCFGLYCRNGACTDLAATGSLPPGSACESAGQCSQAGGAVDCAFNGELTRGATNCCRWAGGACTLDVGCCGDSRCVNGFCSGTTTTTATTTASGGGLSPGASCTTASQCSQSGGYTVCADNGVATDGALNCCRNAGGTCTSGAACCGGLLCTNGVCGGGTTGGTTGGATGGTTGGGGELPPGSTCTADSQCSQAGGALVCRDNGLAPDGSLNCCRYNGGACSAANNSAGCCAGLLCVGGTCQPV